MQKQNNSSRTVVACEVVRRLLLQRKSIKISAVGVSMYPWIRSGDICTFVPLQSAIDANIGDILLYSQDGEKLVAHRIHQVIEAEGPVAYICKGDSNLAVDPLVRFSHVLGKLTTVQKGRFRLHMKGTTARLWGWMMLRCTMPSRIVRLYLARRAT